MTHRQHFDTVDVLRLEVETDPTGLSNLVPNPSGELGGWGWVTPVGGSSIGREAGGFFLTYRSPGGVPSYFYTEAMPTTAGQYAAATWEVLGGPVGYFYRARFEWLNSSKALLSSSTQTGYLSVFSGTQTYGPVVAPASTAYVRLRFDAYSNNAGANPAAGVSMYVKDATVAKAATSGELGTVRTNLFKNPSSEVATPWTVFNYLGTPAPTVDRSSTFAYFGSWSTRMLANSSGTTQQIEMGVSTSPGTNYITGLVPGRDYTFQFRARAGTTGRDIQAWLYWRDASGNNTGLGNVTVTGTDVAGAWTLFTGTGTCPAGAVGASIQVRVRSWPANMAASEAHYFDAFMVEEASSVGDYFDGATTDAGGWDYGWTGTAHASTSTAALADLSFIEPVEYLNILQECKEISVNRSALDLGTMTAEVLSTALDPSTSDLIRPGRRVRLLSLDDADTWQPLFTGRISSASVVYELKDPTVPAGKRARVTLTAVDAISDLAQQKRTEGVASVDDLPYVLEGCGVPWNVNGSGNQVASATISAVNENASALDQIAVTRDSNLAYAWVDRFGVINVFDDPWDAYDSGSTLIDNDVSELDLSYNTQDCINEVWIKYLRYNATTQETEEVAYGPYRDETSISEWGVRSAEFTVQGIGEGTVATYAASILTANATPEVTLNSATVPMIDDGDVGNWTQYSDLYSPINPGLTAYDPVGTYLFITSIEHTITPDKWLMKLGFNKEAIVAAPQFVPSPPANNGALDGTWIAATPQNSWTNYGSGFNDASYMRKNGIVYLRGLLKTGNNAQAMFTLPAGYRPGGATNIYPGVFAVKQSSGASAGTAHTHTVAEIAGRVNVTSAGAVIPIGVVGIGTWWVSVDGICFPAEA